MEKLSFRHTEHFENKTRINFDFKQIGFFRGDDRFLHKPSPVGKVDCRKARRMRCSPFVLYKFRAPQIHIVRILQYELASLLCKHCRYRGPLDVLLAKLDGCLQHCSPRGKAYEYSGQLTDKSKFEVQNLAVGRDIVKTRPKERRHLGADIVGSDGAPLRMTPLEGFSCV